MKFLRESENDYCVYWSPVLERRHRKADEGGQRGTPCTASVSFAGNRLQGKGGGRDAGTRSFSAAGGGRGLQAVKSPAAERNL